MANPQAENGHIDIALEVVEKFCSYRISGEEWLVLWAILRKTYGWHKKEDRISLSQFAVITGLKRQTVLRAISKLSSKKMIGVIKNDSSGINMYSFIKDFDKWEPLSKKITVSSKKIMPVIKKDNWGESKKGHTKENITKENIQKKNTLAHFETFWKIYPKKKSKGQAEKAWKATKPDEQLLATMIATIERATKSEDWLKEGGKWIPYPATWLNAKGWADEITSAPNGHISPQPKAEAWANCPKCGKETARDDIWRIGSCPACYKPADPGKVKEMLKQIQILGGGTKNGEGKERCDFNSDGGD